MSYCPSSSIIMMPERLQSFTNMLPGSAVVTGANSGGLPAYPPTLPAHQPQLHSNSLVGASPDENNNNNHGVLKMCGTQHQQGTSSAAGISGNLVNAMQNFKKIEGIHHHHHHQQNDLGKNTQFIFIFYISVCDSRVRKLLCQQYRSFRR